MNLIIPYYKNADLKYEVYDIMEHSCVPQMFRRDKPFFNKYQPVIEFYTLTSFRKLLEVFFKFPPANFHPWQMASLVSQFQFPFNRDTSERTNMSKNELWSN